MSSIISCMKVVYISYDVDLSLHVLREVAWKEFTFATTW